MLFLDFETRSTVDIKRSGADVYARHPSTEVMCVGYAIDDLPACVVSPSRFTSLAKKMGSQPIVAQNAPFELVIWNETCVPKYGWPPLKPEQMICTMAQSYAMACPGGLADAAPAFGMTIQKDSVGHRIMMQLSQPRKVTEGGCLFCDGRPICAHCWGSGHLYEWYTPENAPEKFEQLYAYCKQDIEVERGLFKRQMRLSPREQELWILDRKINDRGVQIDTRAVNAAIQIVEAEKKRFDLAMREVTDNAVATATATGQLTDWLKMKGIRCEGVAKADVLDLLRKELPGNVRQALLIRQEASKSSTAKLKAMLASVCSDGRMRGLFQYHGATTGRWAGRRTQLQNFPRSTIPQADIENVFSLLDQIS